MKSSRMSGVFFLILIFLTQFIIAQNKLYEDKQQGFKITVPTSYTSNVMTEGTDKIYAFLSSDQNLAIRVRSFSIDPNLDIQQVKKLFEDNIITNATLLGQQNYSLNNSTGIVCGYKWKFNNIDVGIAAYYTKLNSMAYVVWTMLPANLYNDRIDESDAITNSFYVFDPVNNQNNAGQLNHQQQTNNNSQNFKALVIDDAGIEVNIPVKFVKTDQQVGQSTWTDPSQNEKIKLIIQSVTRENGQTMDRVATRVVEQVHSSSAAKLLDANNLRLGGMQCKLLKYELNQNGAITYFNYIYVDSPLNIVALGFVSPGNLGSLSNSYMDEMRKSLKKNVSQGSTGNNSTENNNPQNRNSINNSKFGNHVAANANINKNTQKGSSQVTSGYTLYSDYKNIQFEIPKDWKKSTANRILQWNNPNGGMIMMRKSSDLNPQFKTIESAVNSLKNGTMKYLGSKVVAGITCHLFQDKNMLGMGNNIEVRYDHVLFELNNKVYGKEVYWLTFYAKSKEFKNLLAPAEHLFNTLVHWIAR